MAVRDVEFKGVNFRGFARSVETLFGHEGLARWAGCLRSPVAELYARGGLLPSVWYPAAYYAEYHRASQSAFGGGPALARRIAYAAVEADFRGVYRALVQLLAPHTLISWAPRALANYFRGGSTRILESRHGYCRLRMDDYRGMDENIWHDIIGGATAGLEMCGATHTRFRILEGGGTADAVLDVEFRWV